MARVTAAAKEAAVASVQKKAAARAKETTNPTAPPAASGGAREPGTKAGGTHPSPLKHGGHTTGKGGRRGTGGHTPWKWKRGGRWAGTQPQPAAGTQANGVATGNRFEGLPEEDPGEGGDGK